LKNIFRLFITAAGFELDNLGSEAIGTGHHIQQNDTQHNTHNGFFGDTKNK
jgi:hypothetical protein